MHCPSPAASEAAPRPSRVHIPELDGIRGAAILGVLLFHYRLLIPQQSGIEYVWLKALAPWWIGVDLFFALSGFLITGILLDTKNSPAYFRTFYWRRLLRIFPLYYATLAVIAVIAAWSHNPEITNFNTEQFWFWTYLSNWRAASQNISDFLPHLWSLAVEEQFYLVWPIVVLVTPRKYLGRLAIGLFVASFIYRAAAVELGYPRYGYFATPARVGELALGAFIALAVRKAQAKTPALLWLGFLLTGVAAVWGAGFEANKGPVIVLGIGGLSILFAALVHQGALGKLPGFRAPWLTWLGKYSYGIYMLHPFVLKWEQPLLHDPLTRLPLALRLPATAVTILLGMAASCAAAWVSFHLLEAPFLRLKNLHSRPQI